MPRIDELLERVGSAAYITTLDLSRGYWQLALAPEARELTAFKTPFGLFQFRVMPFGLQGAPATFQRLMDHVLRDVSQFSAAYLDDVVIYSRSWKEHLHHLQEVLKRIQAAGLTINPKVRNGSSRSRVPWVHYRIWEDKASSSEDGGHPFLPCTHNKEEAILNDLTKNSAPNKVRWTEACNRAFNDLKESICTRPVLQSPDFDLPFILQTDASGVGLERSFFRKRMETEDQSAQIARGVFEELPFCDEELETQPCKTKKPKAQKRREKFVGSQKGKEELPKPLSPLEVCIPSDIGALQKEDATLKPWFDKVKEQEGIKTGKGKDWDQWLPYLLFAYREVPQASTGFSPFELLYGRQVRGPLDLLKDHWERTEPEGDNVVAYVLKMRERLQAMAAMAQENLKAAQTSQKRGMTRRRRTEPSTRSKVSNVTYELFMPERLKKHQVFHINLLKEFIVRQEPSQQFLVRAVKDEEVSEKFFPIPAAEPAAIDLSHLSPSQQDELKPLLNADLFQETPGFTSLVQHQIRLKQDAPKRQRSYRIPERYLNAISNFDPYPMPRIDELLERCGGAAYITTLDLSRGYWQLALAPEARELTAFKTPLFAGRGVQQSLHDLKESICTRPVFRVLIRPAVHPPNRCFWSGTRSGPSSGKGWRQKTSRVPESSAAGPGDSLLGGREGVFGDEVGYRLTPLLPARKTLHPGDRSPSTPMAASHERGKHQDRRMVAKRSLVNELSLYGSRPNQVRRLAQGGVSLGPVDSVELLQPGSVLLQPAHTLTISCRVSGYSLTDNSYATGWIRQREGKLQWVFYQWGSSSGNLYQNDALKNKFSFRRDMSAGTVTIQGQSLQSEDSGVYYCVRAAQ
ncbi:hypothetical protein WMY93_003076 [Mugilogobius chulae]|uniref:ribonuclease H n=1 Tax=Mugilogobius chulae TaxID=88201 RepID=A0AAW0PX97_9GOBI